MLKNLKSLWPIFLLVFIAWFLYNNWLQQISGKTIFSNSIEAKDVRVSSKVTGRIKNTYIKEGNRVQKGQKLLELEGDEIVARLDQAKASLNKAKFNLIDLQKGARPQEIKKEEANTNLTNAKLEQAKADYKNIVADFERINNLFKEGAVSKQTYDDYIKQKEIKEKEVTALEEESIKAKNTEDLIKEGARVDQIKSLKAEVSYFSAQIKEFEKYVNELTVIAPWDGEISSFDLEPGEVVKANQPLLTITDITNIYVRIYLPSTLLSKIKLMQKVTLKADSYPKELFKGYVSYIGAKAEYTPRNVQTPEERTKLVYPIKIQIENKDNKLRHGMYVTLKL